MFANQTGTFVPPLAITDLAPVKGCSTKKNVSVHGMRSKTINRQALAIGPANELTPNAASSIPRLSAIRACALVEQLERTGSAEGEKRPISETASGSQSPIGSRELTWYGEQ
jgi:hypothetical protein